MLDHIAKPFIRDGVVEPWATDIRQLARHANVTCKISGMVTEADWDSWQADDFRPYLDIIFDAFGPQRVLFGSDWPVCTLAASYAQVHDLVDAYVQQFNATEQEAFWGQNAARDYRLKPSP